MVAAGPNVEASSRTRLGRRRTPTDWAGCHWEAKLRLQALSTQPVPFVWAAVGRAGYFSRTPPTGLTLFVWHCICTTTNVQGCGIKKWYALPAHARDALIALETQRGHRLAEMSHSLDPTDAQACAPQPLADGTLLKLVDTRRIAPLTSMTQASMADAYRWERIPEEQDLTWQLDPENQAAGRIEAYSYGFEADPFFLQKKWQSSTH